MYYIVVHKEVAVYNYNYIILSCLLLMQQFLHEVLVASIFYLFFTIFIFYYIYLSAVVYKAVIILYKTSYYLFLGIQKRHVTLLSSLS